MATAADMVTALEAALTETVDLAGVVQVTVDGTTTNFNRQQALDELDRWRREAAAASTKRPRLSSINLANAW